MELSGMDCRVLLYFYFVILNPLLAASSRPPNIILIVADDLGFNDVGFHGSEIFTPNLDKLAKTGVTLENYYVSPSCTPSRSQLLTGRYGIHTGQIRNIQSMQQSCLRLDEVTIAEKLKARNYRTHMVGKWHLGHCMTECTPTHRGFDSFFGILLGSGDHFRYYKKQTVKGVTHLGYDFWQNNTVSRAEGLTRIYSTTTYRNQALRIISTHDPRHPLFLYLSFQAPHSPLQVPREWLKQNSGITNWKRRYIAGMVTAVDSAVGVLVESLKSRGLWENTVLVFTTDNGGQIMNGASNWPLRGGKGSFWEGGVRGVGFVNSRLIKRPGRKSHRLMHVSDWFPTFVHLSQGDLNGTKPLDGVNQWDAISRNTPSPRKDVLIGISHAIDRSLDKRRISAECRRYIPKELRACGRKKLFKFPKKCAKKEDDSCLTYKGSKWCQRAAIRRGKWKLLVGIQKPGNWVRGLGVKPYCSSRYENEKRLQLFNIRSDPRETDDLSQRYPKIVAKLMAKLENYRRHSVPEWRSPIDIMGSPKYNGGVWGPWMTAA
jgi:arylsulfatase A-like enzyme